MLILLGSCEVNGSGGGECSPGVLTLLHHITPLSQRPQQRVLRPAEGQPRLRVLGADHRELPVDTLNMGATPYIALLVEVKGAK